MIFVEYNSWESNSGAHNFNWHDDTEIFYNNTNITIRWKNGEKNIQTPHIANINTSNNIDWKNYEIIKPWKPSNWLITDKHIYITTDIWLCRLSFDMKPLNWKRGMFRFNHLQLCENGDIFAFPSLYDYCLTDKVTKRKIIFNKIIFDNTNYDNLNLSMCKYGCLAKCNLTNDFVFVHLHNDGQFSLEKVYEK